MKKYNVDEKIMKYIPKELHEHIVWCSKWKDTYANYTCYDVGFDESYNDDNGEQTSFIAHGIKEMQWCCKVIKEGRRGEIL